MKKIAAKTNQSRYLRQETVKEIGFSQKKLKNKTVAVIGLGGIGGMSAQLLARAGIGNLILIDKDNVELINIHRQVLYKEADIGRNKALLAMQKLKKINSEINIRALHIELNSSNIKKCFEKLENRPDLILDCTDNLKARLAINEYCIKTKTPWIFATALGTKGMVCSLFGKTLQSGWFAKEFSEKKDFDTTVEAGVLSTACNTVACIQITEALKLLLSKKESSELIRIDIWKNEIEIVSI